MQLPVGLHVHQAHFGAGQQPADHLQPAARPVQHPRGAGRLLLDAPFPVRADHLLGVRVLHVVHELEHLVRRRVYVIAAHNGKTTRVIG